MQIARKNYDLTMIVRGYRETETQIKAPRVTPLEGVSTYARRHTCARSREPAGFRHDERRFVDRDFQQQSKRNSTRMTQIKRMFTDPV